VSETEANKGSPVYRRKLIGRISSDKMNKTVVVEVIRFKRDTMYKKYVRVKKKYKAHDETNQYKTGDRVEIQEHRPLSAEKRFIVTRLNNRPASELTVK
jgi:small subunit ribosomal protein S17